MSKDNRNRTSAADSTNLTDPTVCSKLLHAYLGFGTPFDNWSLELRLLARMILPHLASEDLSSRVPVDLAFCAAAGGTLDDAVPLILIADHSHLPPSDQSMKLDKELRQFLNLAKLPGWVDSASLHEFLEIEEPFLSWINSVITKPGVCRSRDFLKISPGKEVQTGETPLIGGKVARDICMSEKTSRSAQMRLCFSLKPVLTIREIRGAIGVLMKVRSNPTAIQTI